MDAESESDDSLDDAQQKDPAANANANAPTSCLEESTDPESLIAELAFRYTVAPSHGSAEKSEASAKALMSSLNGFFDLLRHRPIDVSNTIVWICLGCAEDGTLDQSHQLDERTVRCLRFLTSLIADGRDEGSTRVGAVSSLVEAVRINLEHNATVSVAANCIASWLGIGRDAPRRAV